MQTAPSEVSLRRVFQSWWPLAFSWLMMAMELPVLSAVIARLANPDISLAAYGGVIFPLALIIESPVIMLLAASTALSKDWDSYLKLYRFMMTISAILTGIHILIAFTPLYYIVVGRIIGVPQEIVEPARIGLMIMTPWTWAIAYRRFNQGVLIRFGHSHTVTIGTGIRLGADLIVLIIGLIVGRVSGVVVATIAVALGVTSEAAYAGLAVRPVVRNQVRRAPPVQEKLTLWGFLEFYIPLAMTSLITLLAQPIGSAAVSRMPLALESLAIWPVISGLLLIFRSLGLAYNEVVVALLDEKGSSASLIRFAAILSASTSLALFLLSATPLARVWFADLSALNSELVEIALPALWLSLPLPALAVLQSLYQGTILHGKRTRGVTEAVFIYLACIGVLLVAGVIWGQVTGLYIGLAAMGVSTFAQTVWLWYRSRPTLIRVRERDAALSPSA